ncbi:MAG: ion channel [Nodosilinea sp.]
MALWSKQRPSQRIIVRDGEYPDIVRIGDPQPPWRDLYHRLLTLSWPGFIGSLALTYLAINLLFALAYVADANAIANARPKSLLDAFFFSVQTMASIGYGAMYPQTVYANSLVVLEALVGLLFIAVITGLSFARFSLPTARIVFSQYAVIAPYNGVSTLMFRAANKRRNRILEAHLWVTLVRDEKTAEGEFFRHFYDLELARSHSPLFGLSWTAMHPIDAHSPLFGETPASLAAAAAEIIVILAGIDETMAQTIHGRHSFVADEILWHHQFLDILGWTTDGRRSIDFRNFHGVKEIKKSTSQ